MYVIYLVNGRVQNIWQRDTFTRCMHLVHGIIHKMHPNYDAASELLLRETLYTCGFAMLNDEVGIQIIAQLGLER
jgi:hypothetical protein